VVGLLTGHCHLKWHLFKLGLSDCPTCERCQEKDETAMHVLCECEALAHRRLLHLGQYFMDPSDYFDAPHRRSCISFEVQDCWRDEQKGKLNRPL
jgi:hypothetical protein